MFTRLVKCGDKYYIKRWRGLWFDYLNIGIYHGNESSYTSLYLLEEDKYEFCSFDTEDQAILRWKKHIERTSKEICKTIRYL